MKIRVGLTKTPKAKPAPGQKLGFGRIFSDHMFVMNYKTGKGWHNPRIVPYGELSLSPAALCLHYGQTVFEGMKAYYGQQGDILLFRPDENFARLNRSNQRMAIPPIDEELCIQGVKKLVEIE